MMNTVLKSLMMLGSVLFLMSCGNSQKATFENLAGDWSIVKVSGNALGKDSEAFLGFDVNEKRLYGNAGCNALMGELQSSAAGSIDFLSVGSTKRMCQDMAAEDAILQAMGAVKGFSIEGNQLVLTDAEGQVLMELMKK